MMMQLNKGRFGEAPTAIVWRVGLSSPLAWSTDWRTASMRGHDVSTGWSAVATRDHGSSTHVYTETTNAPAL
jgi:hypothetical protein